MNCCINFWNMKWGIFLEKLLFLFCYYRFNIGTYFGVILKSAFITLLFLEISDFFDKVLVILVTLENLYWRYKVSLCFFKMATPSFFHFIVFIRKYKIISNIFEKIVHSRTMSFLEEHQILSNGQYAFWIDRSTQLLLL